MVKLQENFDVFISFAVEDRPLVNTLADKLNSNNLNVWHSGKLKGGKAIAGEIGQVINQSRYAIIILTDEYLKPGWARTELEHLYNRMAQEKIKLIPVWVDVDLEKIENSFPMLSSIFAIKSSEAQEIADRVSASILTTENRIEKYQDNINLLEKEFHQLKEDSDKNTDIEHKIAYKKVEVELDTLKEELVKIKREKGVLPPKELIKKNNKKWMLSIMLFLIFGSVGYGIYYQITMLDPDYDLYLEYIKKGDELLASENFEEAEAAFKQALLYNPNDKKLETKIDLLNEAKRAIENGEYEKAKQNFELIIKIPPSKKLEIKKTDPEILDQKMLTLTISFIDGILSLLVSGGNPFNTPDSPYIIEGIGCEDCVSWEKVDETTYKAIINDTINNALTIVILDSAGNIVSDYLDYTETENIVSNEAKDNFIEEDTTAVADKKEEPLKEEPAKEEEIKEEIPEEKEEEIAEEEKPDEAIEPTPIELFNTARNEGDNLFKDRKFKPAIQEYEKALTHMPADTYCKNQIDKCNSELSILELNALKNIQTNSIASGTFKQGNDEGLADEQGGKNILLSPFKMGLTEVTVGEYKTFCKAEGKSMPPEPSWGWNDNHPIVNVTWQEANDYAKWVGGRLPTEAEWEFAAKGATRQSSKTKYSGSNQLAEVGWYKANSGNITQNAKSKKPNALGLFGMTGNVAEWCSDWYDKQAYLNNTDQNPKGPSSGRKRVVRGGSYLSSPDNIGGDQLSVTYRNSKKPNERESYIGFRVIKN